MKLNQARQFFELCFNSNVTPALVGTSGVGKTSIPKQLYKDMGFDSFIILRPSLIADVGDLVGLPDFQVIKLQDGTEETRTTFQSPDWLPQQGEKALVVVDEINRTNKDIIMAMFDLIEAEKPKIGKYELPKGSRVIATLNPPTDEYTVLDIKDNAFTSRMCFLKVVPDKEVFLNWGEQGNLDSTMIDFLNANDKFFGLGEDFEVEQFGLNIRDNNRSKKKVSDLTVAFKELGFSDYNVLFECVRGIGGKEFAHTYVEFVKNHSDVVTVDDMLENTAKMKRLDYDNLGHLAKINDQLSAYFREEKIKSSQYENIAQYLSKVPADTFQGFIDTFVADTDENGEAIEFTPTVIEFTDYLGNHEGIQSKIDTIKAAREEINEETTESEEV